MSGVPVAFLAVAADGSFIKSILSDGDEEEKQITLDGVETDIISSYVSLLCTGWLQMGDIRYSKSHPLIQNLERINS